MSDLALSFDGNSFRADLVIANGDLMVDLSARSWVIASLFTNKTASNDNLPDFYFDRQGFWASPAFGSYLWLLWREKQTEETRLRAEQYAREALAWFVSQGIAKSVTVRCEWIANGTLGFDIVLTRADNVPERYSDLVWRLAA